MKNRALIKSQERRQAEANRIVKEALAKPRVAHVQPEGVTTDAHGNVHIGVDPVVVNVRQTN